MRRIALTSLATCLFLAGGSFFFHRWGCTVELCISGRYSIDSDPIWAKNPITDAIFIRSDWIANKIYPDPIRYNEVKIGNTEHGTATPQ